MKNLLIKNAVIVNRDGRQTGDLLVRDGLIEAIGEGLPAEGCEVIDARAPTCCPGLSICTAICATPAMNIKRTSFPEPARRPRGALPRCSAWANTKPVNDCAAITRYIVEKAQAAGYCKVYPYGAVTKGLEGKELAEMGDMREAGAVAFSDDGAPVDNTRLMEAALLYAGRFDGYIARPSGGPQPDRRRRDEPRRDRHRPRTAGHLPRRGGGPHRRDLILAEENRARVHICHISTAGCVDLIRSAKARGVRVTCETTPHYLTLDDTACEGYDVNAKVAPPLRTPGRPGGSDPGAARRHHRRDCHRPCAAPYRRQGGRISHCGQGNFRLRDGVRLLLYPSGQGRIFDP